MLRCSIFQSIVALRAECMKFAWQSTCWPMRSAVREPRGCETWCRSVPRFMVSHSIMFPWSRDWSRVKWFHESISIVISGTRVKSERKEPEPYNSAATSTSSSSSSSSSFSFTVGCPRLTFRARYTSRTRKPRRVRLQTEFACKTRSSRRWRSFIVQPETLEYPYVVAFPVSPALKRYS